MVAMIAGIIVLGIYPQPVVNALRPPSKAVALSSGHSAL
jgi:NADH:ubiquinone oxidoreductase subunit 4 (subunit M)